ncbi:hypothetical protein [Azospirillum palustre]
MTMDEQPDPPASEEKGEDSGATPESGPKAPMPPAGPDAVSAVRTPPSPPTTPAQTEERPTSDPAVMPSPVPDSIEARITPKNTADQERAEDAQGNVGSDFSEKKPNDKEEINIQDNAHSGKINSKIENAEVVNQAQSIINKFYGDRSGNDESKNDPTTVFPEDFNDVIIPKDDRIEKFSGILERKRILMITAPQDEEIIGAALSLFEQRVHKQKTRRSVQRINNLPLDDQFALHDLRRAKVAGGMPAAVLVIGSDDEMSGIVPRDKLQCAHLREYFQSKDIIVILGSTQSARLPKPLLIDHWNLAPITPVDASQPVERAIGRYEISVLQEKPDETLIRLTALYVAVCFDSIPISGFEQLMELLLDGKTVERPDTGGVRTFGRSRSMPAAALWRERGDAVLTALGISTRTDRDGRKVLALRLPEDARAAALFLEETQSLFCNQQFETLMAHHVILRSDISTAVADRAMALFVTTMRAQPERCGDILNGLVEEIAGKISGMMRVVQHSVAASIVDFFARGFGQKAGVSTRLRTLFDRQKTSRRDDLVGRVARLFTMLDADPLLQPVAWTLLDRVGSQDHQEFVCDLLLAISDDRRYRPSSMFWSRFRSWYDQAKSNEIRARYYQYIGRLLSRNNGDVFPILNVMFGWLPASDKPLSKPSGGAALAILHDYLMHSLETVNFADPGHWPPTIPLLAELADETEDARCRDLVQWIFHPAWRYFNVPLSSDGQDAPSDSAWEENRLMMAIMFVACVVHLLTEPAAERQLDPRSEKLAERLLTAALDVLDKKMQGWMRGAFDIYKGQLLKLRIENFANAELRSLIDRQRHALSDALRMWQSIRSSRQTVPARTFTWFQ